MGTVHRHRLLTATPSLATYAESLDAERHLPRDDVAQRLDRLLLDEGSTRILVVAGPGGLGKSATLREAARRGERAGYRAIHLDGPELAASLPDLGPEVDPDSPVPLLMLVDEVDALGAAASVLGRALAALPHTTRVVVTGRRPPVHWLPAALEPLAARLRLTPLDEESAGRLLAIHGVDDPGAEARIRAWARGVPLALVLGASAWADDPAGLDAALAGNTGADLVARLTGLTHDQLDSDEVRAAAVTGWADADLLTAALPGTSGDEALATLTTYSFVEPSRDGARLHPIVAEVVGHRGRAAGENHRSLQLRVASHLFGCGLEGDRRAVQLLAGLVQNPTMRGALEVTGREDLYVDRPTAADLPPLREAVRRTHPDAWPLIQPWLRGDRPGPVGHVVRRADGRCVAAAAAVSLSAAAGLDDDRAALVGPLVDRAAALGITRRVVLSPFQITLVDDPAVNSFRNATAAQRCGVANPRYDLVYEIGWGAGELDLLSTYGYRPLESADGHGLTCWYSDAGPTGLAGLLFGAVVAEQGAAPPPAMDAGPQLLAALDDFHSDTVLAALPVAPLGHTRADAADHVRQWVRRVVGIALGDEPALALQITRRYLEPDRSHDDVMNDLFLSRAAYFRRQRRARELVAAAADDAWG